MTKHLDSARLIGWALLMAMLLANSALADITVQHNVAFNATKRNPYTGGAAFEETATHRLFNESFRADIPPIDADPLGVALEAFLGVDLPSVVELQVGGTVAGSAKLEFGYYVTSGRLDINYPASTNLTVQTNANNAVLAGQSYSIGSQFLPGVSPRVVTSQFLQTQGGAGYHSAPLLAFDTYEKPSFATTSPWASAWLDASADIRAGMFAKVSALAGLQEWRKDFKAGGQVGGRLVEIDPTGLYVSGEQIIGVDLDEPIGPFPIAGNAAQLTIQIPKLDVASGPSNGPVVTATAVKPVVTLTGNLEKLIPFVGGFLHNSIGPFEYDLLQLKAGPQIGLYQNMTFTPDPQVQLNFSEPVLVRGARCADEFDTICVGPGSLLETYRARVPVGTPVDWRPMFSNSSSITIKPTYLLKNQFRNETGVDLSLLVDIESLSLKAPFFPTENNTVGPIIDRQLTIPIGRTPLGFLTKQFEIPLPSVTGDVIVVPKVNVGVQFGVGDVSLVTSQYAGPDTQQPGHALYDLTFQRTVVGEPAPRVYQARVSGVDHLLDPEGVSARTLRSSEVVVARNQATNESIAVGYDVCLNNCDLSLLQPASSPAYVDPNPAVGKLYVTHLPDDPNIGVNVVAHAKLGQYSAPPQNNTMDRTEGGVDVVDKLNRPITTILARSGEIVPAGISEFNSFRVLRLQANGEVLLDARLNRFAPDVAEIGVYLGADAAKVPVLRGGDLVPGGGRLPTDDHEWEFAPRDTNESGQVVKVSNFEEGGNALFRAGPGGLTPIVRRGQATPEGNGEFVNYTPQKLNNAGQVVFDAVVLRGDGLAFERGIYLGDGNTLAKIVRQGDRSPDTNSPFDFIGEAALASNGRVTFGAHRADGGSGVYAGSGGPLTKIVASGDAAPFGGSFTAFGGVVGNDAGLVAINAFVGPTGGGSGYDGIFVSGGGATVRVARAAQLAPDGDGAFVANSFSVKQLNDARQVLFYASVQGSANYQAVFVGDEHDVDLAARVGAPIPGGGLLSGLRNHPQLNNHGHVALTGLISGNVGAADGDGVLLYDGKNMIPLARPGQPLAGSVVVRATVGDINDNMQVAYDVQLADGRTVAARFEPTLYWRIPGNGLWGAPENWSLLIEPFDPYDVNVNVPGGGTIKIPFGNGGRRTINSLAIGSEAPGAATSKLELETGVQLLAVHGTTLRYGGSLSGEGTVEGDVFNRAGEVSPGRLPVLSGGNFIFTPGELRIAGDYTQEALGQLRIELRGTIPGQQHDRLTITGDAELGGTLAVYSLSGFGPLVGDAFTFLTYQDVYGEFGDLSVPLLPDGRGWRLMYTQSGATLTVVPAALPGDADLDGDVDRNDLARLTASFGRTYDAGAYNFTTDLNHDGTMNLIDLALLQARLGQTAPSPVAAIPEPATAWIATSSLLAMMVMSGRRHQYRPSRHLQTLL